MIRQYLAGLALAGLAIGSFVACNNEPPDDTPDNQAPVAENVSAETTNLDPDQSVELTLNAYDPDFFNSEDDSLVAVSASGEMLEDSDATHRVEWTVSDSDWSIDGNGLSATLTAPNAYEQETNITAKIIDMGNEDLTASATLEGVVTGENVRPAISGIDASPSPVTPGGNVTLTGSADDPVDDLNYSWSIESDDAWSLTSNSGQEVNLIAPDSDDSDAQVTLTVSDGYGLSDSLQTSVRTTENRPPSINSITAGPPQVDPGESSTVSVSASDPDGNDLSYDWSGDNAWSIDGSGAEVDVTSPEDFGLSGTFTVTVTDSRGASTTGNIVVSTKTNGGPVISGITAQPPQVDRDGSSTVQVNASHPNGAQLSYDWSVSNPDWSIAPSRSSANIRAPDIPGSSTTVSVTVSDSAGKSLETSTFLYTAQNQQPDIGSINTTDNNVEPEGYVDVTLNSSDPDGDDLSYDWSITSPWSVNGGGDTVRLIAPDEYGVSAVAQVTITDEFGATNDASITVSTVRNQSPSVSANANPAQMQPGDSSTLTAVANDPNGDSLSYSWNVPSNWSSSGSGSSINITAPSDYGVTDTVTVQVSDGYGGTAIDTVNVSTAPNQAPTINSISSNPTGALKPMESKVLSVDAQANGGSLNYSWSVPSNWTVQSGSTSATLSVQAPNAYGQSGIATIAISDGNGGVTQASVILETENNEDPVLLDLVDVNPTTIDCSTSALADVRAYDPNGDSLTYTWTVSNTTNFSVASTNGDEATIELVDAMAATSYTTDVSVTVSDGYGGTASDTFSSIQGNGGATGCSP